MSREVMQMAIEALEQITTSETFYRDPRGDHAGPVIDALRAELAKPDDKAQPDDGGPISEGWQVTVSYGHSGFGAYAHMTEYPEEGAVFLAAPQPPAEQGEYPPLPESVDSLSEADGFNVIQEQPVFTAEQMRAYVDADRAMRGAAKQEVEQGAELSDEQIKKDAARYRWLRNPTQDVTLVLDKVVGYTPIDELGGGGYHHYEYRSGEDLDGAIDAIITADRKARGGAA